MKKLVLLAIALALACFNVAAQAQNLTGDWQGISKGTAPGNDLRLVLKIAKSEGGGWT
jgi:hypothetical protein